MLRLLQQFRNRLLALLKNSDKQDKLDLEIQGHLELMTEENIEAGMSPDQAKKAALKRFGATEKVKDECRDSWGIRIVSDFIGDLLFAVRMIGKDRLFSFVVIVTIALGIGVNTTVFTIVNSILFKPFPNPHGDKLVVIRSNNLTRPGSQFAVSYPDFKDFREYNKSFQRIEGFQAGSFTLSESANPPEQFSGGYVTQGLLDTISAIPIIGRSFHEEDFVPDASRVVLISYDIWQNRYAGSEDVVGSEVRLNRTPATIVGVMPEKFRFPMRHHVWVPLILSPNLENRNHRTLDVYGVLHDRDTPVSARTDLATIAHRIASDYPDENKDISVNVLAVHEDVNGGNVRVAFLVMLGAVFFVLLIACANIANMMLSRNINRLHEFTVRTSLGASRWQLIRQLLIESLLLSSLGGLIGLGIAMFGVHAFDLAVQDRGVPYWIVFEMNFRVYVYFACICVLSGILFGLVPASRTTRIDLTTTLKDSATSTGSTRAGKLTTCLVVLQFALTVVLLSGAGQTVRGFFIAQNLNGFIPHDEIFTADLQIPSDKGNRYTESSARSQLFDTLFQRMKTIPGVEAVAATSNPPGMGAARARFEVEGKPEPVVNKAPGLSFVAVTDDYFSTIGLAVLRGDGFDNFIQEDGTLVAVASLSFSQRCWPGESSIGKRFRLFENGKAQPWITIIGVSADIEQNPSESAFLPLVFFPYKQLQRNPPMTLTLRSSGDAGALSNPVRTLVQEIDQDMLLLNTGTLREQMSSRLFGIKIGGVLFLSFAGIGLVIASVGVYGVIAQSTALRTQEVGIRMVLGATGGKVLKLVLRRGFIQITIGLVLGLIGALGTTNLMRPFTQTHVSSLDLTINIGIILVIALVGLLACWFPAKQAISLQPSEALRHH